MDSEIQEVVELLFSRKLETFRHAIEAETNGATSDDPSAMARGARLAVCSELFRGHCARMLRDYVALLELFDALALPEGLGSSFDAHVDETASVLLATLDATGQAERNRVSNQAASIKSETGAELRDEIERAQIAKDRNEKGAAGPVELDDRLPLGRRGAFDRDLSRAVAEAESDGEPFALVMIDIDHFKKVNDEHGHPVGDEVLLEVAKLVVNRAVRKGAAYRFGGEEFALLLPGYSAEEAVGLAERIRKDLEVATVSSKKLQVTASFGAASVPSHAKKPEALLERADAALYEAKRSGRNRVATPS
ncbi:MAG: hypothetical protein BMS9Abin37_3003 [Acidobacteriota bacterium]|nr:MAG: hypothetical protein BMS9Abin37_3003 [Acidobacteriota bacterium]